jgi:hypothetical protein
MEAPRESRASETLASWVQYLGMTIAMLGGATWPAPRASVVVAGLVVLCAGIAWARLARGRSASAAAASADRPLAYARGRIEDALARTRALREGAEAEPAASLCSELEAIVRECVEAVADRQEALSREHGFAGYASVMTPFAAAERWLNRAWSAASDGHTPEAKTSLTRAAEHCDEALRAADALADAARTTRAA